MGVEITYVREDEPLGTAGALRLMTWPDEPLLVVNGDIVTNVNYKAMLRYHLEQEADITVGVRKYDLAIPYGVLECEGPTVLGVEEKPVNTFLINAGIYLVQPSVIDHIPSEGSYDMTDLIRNLVEQNRTVVAFPIHEYWLDIGEHGDYSRAQEEHHRGLFG